MRVSRRWIGGAVTAVLVAARLVVGSGTNVTRAVGAPRHEPVVWGSRLTGTKAYGAWGSPVAGASALSTSAPSGGGTLGAREDDDGPLTKLRDMVAFGGGTVEGFAEGGSASSTTGHMLAVVRNSAGTHEVWGWGYNTSGQLGNGALVNTNAPVKALWTPRSGEVVEQLAVGRTHSLMLTVQGATRRVYAWGSNTYGQLGVAALSMSSSTKQSTPRQIDALTSENVVSIAAGHSHSAAAAADGSVWVWGWDAGAATTAYGNLGVSGTTARPVPVKMTNDTVNVRRAVPTTYSITNNVLTVNTSGRHHFDVGDTVVQSLGDPELDGSRTITAVTATSYSVLAQPNMTARATVGALTATVPTATPSAGSITNNVATLTLSGIHDLRVGNVVDIAVGIPAFDGRRSITARAAGSVSYTSQLNVASTALGSPGTVSFANAEPVSVSAKVLSSNVVTLTVPSGYPFAAQNVVTVDIGDATFDGTFTLSSTTATTIRYSRTAANVASAPVTSGTVVLTTPTVSVTNLAISSNVATVTSDAAGPAHNFRTGNQVIVSGLGGNLDGPKSITTYNIANRTLAFTAQPNVASTPVTGTVAMARSTDSISAYSITSNVAAVTITSGHDFEIGNQIMVTGMGGSLDGPKTISAVAATTVSYAVRANQTATAATGTPSAVVTDCSVACPTAPTDVVEVAAGGGYTMARTSAGQVVSWGYAYTDNFGRLGRTTTHTPLVVSLPAGCVAVQIAAGVHSSGAVCANGSIATWGYNNLWNLGTNNNLTFIAAPALVQGIVLGVGETIVDLDVETAGMMVLTSIGAVWTWGAGAYGRLGKSGVTANQRTAQLANRIEPPRSPTASALFSLNYTGGVVDTDGVVWTWGYGPYGLSGRGTNGPTTMRFDRIGIDPTTRIALWDTTYYASVVVMSDGSLWTWGSNGGSTATYFLGDGTTGSRLTPGKVDLPVGIDTALEAHEVTSLDCSYHHCLFTTSNGSIYGWGDAASRQLTLNVTTDRTVPTLLRSGLVNPRVAAGNGYSLYVDIGATGTGGVLYAWGANGSRRAAPNTTTTPLTTYTEVKDMTVPASPATVDGRTTTMSYDAADRLVATDAVSVQGGIVYDARGNMTALGATTFRYDAADRLVEVRDGNTTITLRRDANGSIVATTVGTPDGTATTSSGLGGTVIDGGGQVIAQRLELPGGAVVERRVTDPSADSWTFSDLDGNAWFTTGADGRRLGDVTLYTPFGEPVATSLETPTARSWRSAHDVITLATSRPVVVMGARVYLPEFGRFTQLDPVVGGSANGYDYASQNPVHLDDPTGEAFLDWLPGIFVLSATVASLALIPPASSLLVGAVVGGLLTAGIQLGQYALTRLAGHPSPFTFAQAAEQTALSIAFGGWGGYTGYTRAAIAVKLPIANKAWLLSMLVHYGPRATPPPVQTVGSRVVASSGNGLPGTFDPSVVESVTRSHHLRSSIQSGSAPQPIRRLLFPVITAR